MQSIGPDVVMGGIDYLAQNLLLSYSIIVGADIAAQPKAVPIPFGDLMARSVTDAIRSRVADPSRVFWWAPNAKTNGK